jgi:hypothetical protein
MSDALSQATADLKAAIADQDALEAHSRALDEQRRRLDVERRTAAARVEKCRRTLEAAIRGDSAAAMHGVRAWGDVWRDRAPVRPCDRCAARVVTLEGVAHDYSDGRPHECGARAASGVDVS